MSSQNRDLQNARRRAHRLTGFLSLAIFVPLFIPLAIYAPQAASSVPKELSKPERLQLIKKFGFGHYRGQNFIGFSGPDWNEDSVHQVFQSGIDSPLIRSMARKKGIEIWRVREILAYLKDSPPELTALLFCAHLENRFKSSPFVTTYKSPFLSQQFFKNELDEPNPLDFNRVMFISTPGKSLKASDVSAESTIKLFKVRLALAIFGNQSEIENSLRSRDSSVRFNAKRAMKIHNWLTDHNWMTEVIVGNGKGIHGRSNYAVQSKSEAQFKRFAKAVIDGWNPSLLNPEHRYDETVLLSISTYELKAAIYSSANQDVQVLSK